MIRHLPFVCVLAIAPILAQAQAQQPQQPAPQSAQSPQPPAVANRPQPVQPQAPVAPDAPVLTVHGVCPAGQKEPTDKPDACTLVLTRAQFEALVSSLNVANTNYPPPALRGFATNYANILALAKAGETVGVDKDPRFQDLMRITRARVLAESYRRYIQEKYANPSDDEIAAYYKQNAGRFEQMKIDRIHVPKVDPTRPQDRKPEFEAKARKLADDIRERAAHGEDVTSLQVEVYKTLGLKAQPPQTELSTSPKPTFPANVEQDINALKAGEVTKVEIEPSGYNIYKVRSRNTMPMEQAKALIVREVSQKNIDDALKAATSGVTSDLNEQYFSLRHAAPPQRIPPRAIPPGGTKTAPPK
ncbi:MAG: peptidyl-prolyl cis-trans isomerase [Acidobacteriia bacterium]|nr:peptidyl-prolyl cis-trans isomerase [Terriglobia bacterium]